MIVETPARKTSPTYFLAGMLLAGMICLSSIVSAAPSDSGVQLLQADSRGVTFEVTTGEPVLTNAPGTPETTALWLSACSSAGDEGDAQLPTRTVWIGVPEGVAVTVSASSIQERRFEGFGLASRVASTGFDVPLARVSTVTGLRAQRVAAIEVRPARYDATARRLVVATKIDVHVEFVGQAISRPMPVQEPAFEGIYRELLINYESARRFRRPLGDLGSRRVGPARMNGVSGSSMNGPIGFDVASTWIRVRVDRKGIQEIAGSDLEAAGISLAGIDPAAIRLFTRPGVPLLDEGSACDSCGLSEVATRVEDGGDGHFDPSDRVLFFGLGASGWRDEFPGAGSAPREWLDHPYETTNVYWLTWNGQGLSTPLRWGTRDVTPQLPGAWLAPHYPARLHFEQNDQYVNDLFEPGLIWDQWIWKLVSSFQGSFTASGDASGVVADQPARLRARFWGRLADSGGHQVALTINGTTLSPLAWSGSVHKDIDTTGTWLADGSNQLTMRVLGSSSQQPFGDRAAFLFWEIEFPRRFMAVDDSLEFASPDTTGPIAYSLAPFSDASLDSFLLLDVSDPLRPSALSGWTSADTTSGKAIHFHDVGASKFYFAACARRRQHPQLERADVRSIRTGGADYIVICSDEFEPQAQRLADHRRALAPPFAGATTAVVRMSDILAWYAGGRMDPAAVRNFLRDALSGGGWSPAPSYVCLLGDATYDYKNVYHLGDPDLARKQVPTFGHVVDAGVYSSDDWLVDLDPDSTALPGRIGAPDMIVGRLPAANATEADAMVQKVIAYGENPELGTWRNRMLFVVDDLQQGNVPDPIGGGHIQQADSLERGYLPGWLDREKVSLIEYPFTQGIEKGGARQDVISRLNEGVVFWHYIGHGNPFKLADESAFVLNDVATMANGARLPFFFAAASAVGPFDTPGFNSLAEALVKRPDGGAIATLAGTVTTFSFSNFELGRALYPYLLEPPEDGGARTIGEATYAAKRRTMQSFNDHRHNLLGDPGLRLATPRHDVRIQVYDDETGAALGDSLPLGRRVRLEAEVHDLRDPSSSALLSGFTGRGFVHVTDSPFLLPYALSSYGGTATYIANPRIAYEGRYPVDHGRLTARFVVPVSSVPGPRARASIYVEDGSSDGSGDLAVRIVNGSSSFGDTTGPSIALRFASGGTVVGPRESLSVVLEDPSGIRALPWSPVDQIRLEIDDGQSLSLTDRFQYDDGSYTRGTVPFQLPGLPDGNHVIRVSAADNLAQGTSPHNRSSVRFHFTVASVVDTAIVRALALPNPFMGSTGTRLVFTGLPPGAEASVDVFEVSGRLVRHLVGTSGAGHVQVDWDGRDTRGRTLRAGVYFYHAEVRPTGGRARSFEGRLVLLP